MRKTLRYVAPLSLFLIFVACFTSIADSKLQNDRLLPPGGYVGDDACLSCHEEKKTYLVTAHHLTSRLPTKDSIAGKFGAGENILKTSNPDLFFRMDATGSGFQQTAVVGTPSETVSHSEWFAMVIGSGRKGQTYLYWQDDRLFQLPISYWTELGKWVNSPGYSDGLPNFGRRISPRCLECHASRFESLPHPSAGNRYNKTDYVLGISCEKCHGPGREHVALQPSQAAKSSKAVAKPSGQAIVNLAKLPRERQLDVCGLCHGGIGTERAPAFSFVPGKALGDYLILTVPGPSEAVDVHGNQVALLERSRCFHSPSMTCSTCHDVHIPQRNAAAFSKNCLACHKLESCGVYRKRGPKIAENCIDCHMPKQTSNAIISTHEGTQLQPQVRTHWIKVYPETGSP